MVGRPKKSEAEKLVSVGLAIAPEIDLELEAILENDGRMKGQLTRQIFMRGWAAYKRDGLLVEPKEESTLLKVLKKPARTVGTSKSRQRRA
jgi:hypothetical protein